MHSTSAAWLVGQMQVENFDVPVGVILPELDGVFAADVDVHAAFGVVRFGVIGKIVAGHRGWQQSDRAKAAAPGGKAFRETQ